MILQKSKLIRRVVSNDEAQEFAKKNNIEYFETSAKIYEEVERCFERVTSKILAKFKTKEIDP